MKDKTNTATAIPNNRPPSPFTSIPSLVKCIMIAPLISPRLKIAPIHTVFGTNINIAANNSNTPIRILPLGSKPTSEKM